jgi:hypothetical protein
MRKLSIILSLIAVAATPLASLACPFCSAEQSTLTEEMATSDAAVIATLVKPADQYTDAPRDAIDPDSGKATFRVKHVLFGPEELGDTTELEAIYFGEPDLEASYLIRGIGKPPAEPLEWAIPLALSETAVEYVKQLRTLPESGADRIAFFQDYLQHEDPMLSQDAYDEFARAPYADLKGLKERMNRKQLLAWIEDPSISPSRRRLYLTMLGVCGTEADIPRLEAMLVSDSRELTPAAELLAAASIAAGGPLASTLSVEAIRLDERSKKLGLDAMIACYLTLGGAEGLDLVDERFLSNRQVAGKGADYSHVYSALMALRFLAEEEGSVSMDRVLASARLLLDNPDFADQVIPDLARWEDWSVLDRLTQMYRDAGNEDDEEGAASGGQSNTVQKYVREPIITYLDVAAEQEGDSEKDNLADRAKAALAAIEPIDPDAVRRARSLRAFGFLGQARSTPASSDSAAEDGPPDLSEADADDADLQLDPELQLSDDGAPAAELPDPASFGAEAAVEQGEAPQPDAPPAAESPEKGPKPQQSATAVRAEPALVPPSRTLLILVPTLAGAACFGLFWMILRNGGA